MRIESKKNGRDATLRAADDGRVGYALRKAGMMGQTFVTIRPQPGKQREAHYGVVCEAATLRQARVEALNQSQDRIFRASVDPQNPTTRVWVEEDAELPDGMAT